MKNKILLCYAFFSLTLHCGEQQKQLDLIKQINVKEIENTLHSDYITYACKQLERYKNNNWTIADMQKMINMSQHMQGFHYFHYKKIRDANGDNFIRIAVKKLDLPIVDWLVTKYGVPGITEEDFNSCIASCIKQLHPIITRNATGENTAYNILKTLTMKQGNLPYIHDLNKKPCRELLIKQLILLEIKHKKYESKFSPDKELIKLHTTSSDANQPTINLADMYQNTANKKGNTLSHIVVKSENADELYELITKNYVSFLKNKLEKTVVDLALYNFQTFTENVSNNFQEESKNARCCLFMLLKYIRKIQSNTLDDRYTCCDKHVIKI